MANKVVTSVVMPNTYAEVDAHAKRAAVGTMQDSFDIVESPSLPKVEQPSISFSFTVGQLDAMPERARTSETQG